MRAPSHRYTWEQYLLLEQDSAVRHEFWGGEIYAMAGGTVEHAALTANITAALVSQLRGRPCRAFSADLRIRVQSTGLATYPDVSVICGEIDYDGTDRKKTTVTNPILLVEVLSDSTEGYDRGTKFEHYQQIESLREYVLVSQHEELIEVFRRSSATSAPSWERLEARVGSGIRLTSVDCELKVSDVYSGVVLT